MNSKSNKIFKYIFNYLVLVAILKNVHYLIGISFDLLEAFPLAYIPVGYLIVKNVFYKDLEKTKFAKKDFLYILLVGYTTINILFMMPFFYDVSIVAFLSILKPNNDNCGVGEETMVYIKEYYEKQAKIESEKGKWVHKFAVRA